MEHIKEQLGRLVGSGALTPTATTSPSSSVNQRKRLADTWQILLSRRLVTDPVGSDAYRVFEMDMADLSPRELETGLRKSKDLSAFKNGWFSTPAFRELCKVTPQELGLPPVKDAYQEAANATGDKTKYPWTHPAVYFAAVATGFPLLQEGSEKQSWPVFEYNYAVACERVMKGERLEVPIQQALPEKVIVLATPEQNKAGIQRLKAMLG